MNLLITLAATWPAASLALAVLVGRAIRHADQQLPR